ncbi:hypothetical protein C3L33_12285, partial [Rhododendron williamsianum]
MGNKKFRLSEMIPNAWFYKLKDMGTRTRNPKNTINPPTKKEKQPPTTSSSSSTSSLTCSSLSSSSTSSTTTTTSIPPQNSKTQSQPQSILSHQRKSYYFTRNLNPPPMQDPKSQQTHFPESPKKSPKQYPGTHFQESPRKSPKQKRCNNSKRRPIASINKPFSQKLITTSVSAGCGCRASLDLKSDDYPISPLDSSSDHESLLPELGSDHDRNPENDIVFDINDNSPNAKSDGFRVVTTVELHPILTRMDQKPSKSVELEGKNAQSHGYISNVTEQRTSSVSVSSVRRLSVSSPGVRIRTNSPRIGSRRVQGKGVRGRRSVSESFAVVKSSADPRRDFRESMVEMIVENNLRASKDLEDLLACYLQLNSDEYHEVIIKVFKQIWFDLANVRLK